MTCRFFGREDIFPEIHWMSAACRRHAPVTALKVTVGYSSDVASPVWPEMRGDGWCGDWELNQEWHAKYMAWKRVREPDSADEAQK